MFKLVNMKTIGATALSLSLLGGTLLGPVSTAFAKPIYERTVTKEQRHTLRSFSFSNHSRLGFFFKSYHLGNRSISMR